jgi:hypothetical protein
MGRFGDGEPHELPDKRWGRGRPAAASSLDHVATPAYALQVAHVHVLSTSVFRYSSPLMSTSKKILTIFINYWIWLFMQQCDK